MQAPHTASASSTVSGMEVRRREYSWREKCNSPTPRPLNSGVRITLTIRAQVYRFASDLLNHC